MLCDLELPPINYGDCFYISQEGFLLSCLVILSILLPLRISVTNARVSSKSLPPLEITDWASKLTFFREAIILCLLLLPLLPWWVIVQQHISRMPSPPNPQQSPPWGPLDHMDSRAKRDGEGQRS